MMHDPEPSTEQDGAHDAERASQHETKSKRASRGRRREEPITPPAFEEALARLDEIVARLEDGQLPLDQALSLYEEGVSLYHVCERMLDSADLRLERLRISDGGARGGDEEIFLVETFEIDER